MSASLLTQLTSKCRSWTRATHSAARYRGPISHARSPIKKGRGKDVPAKVETLGLRVWRNLRNSVFALVTDFSPSSDESVTIAAAPSTSRGGVATSGRMSGIRQRVARCGGEGGGV
jgi:hypothetical protein